MKMTTFVVTVLSLSVAPCVFAQVRPSESDSTRLKSFISSPRRRLVAPEMVDAPDEWIERSLAWVDMILDEYPPSIPEHPVRRAALIRLDDILHIESAPRKALVHKFYHSRMEKVISEIETTTVKEGMRIWKLYNHGFFVRTKSVSFTFDLVAGPRWRAEGFPVDLKLMERLVNQSDATFISHRHGDHASSQVAKLFIDQGKPVIASEGLWLKRETRYPIPEEILETREQVSKKLIYPQRSTSIVHTIPIQNGAEVLEVIAFPGHQGKRVVNNVHLVTTPEGFTVIQTGDQSGSQDPGGDFDWIGNIGRNHDVDVLMPNCWTTNIKRTARGVDPHLIMTGHENEMGHTVEHREDYTQTYNRLFGTRYPFVLLSWGEGYHYDKSADNPNPNFIRSWSKLVPSSRHRKALQP